MHAYDARYDTPIYVGQRVVVVGGGNVAMDAAHGQAARRGGDDRLPPFGGGLPARRGGAPRQGGGDRLPDARQSGRGARRRAGGWGTRTAVRRNDARRTRRGGRRRPVEKEGSEFDVPCDVVIMALGTSPNPLLAATTSGLETDRRGCLTADAEGRTTRAGVFCRRRRRDRCRDGDSGHGGRPPCGTRHRRIHPRKNINLLNL